MRRAGPRSRYGGRPTPRCSRVWRLARSNRSLWRSTVSVRAALAQRVDRGFEFKSCLDRLAGRYLGQRRRRLRKGGVLYGQCPVRPLSCWALEQKAAANRQVIAVMRQRLAAGEQLARMYQEPGLAWLERQAEVAEGLVAERQAGKRDR
jgi:hypothetical protein